METSEPNKPQKRRWSWRQYSISTLLVFVTIVSVGLGLVRNRAERQRRAVAAIRESGGWVRYEFEPTDGTPAELPGPDWLCRLLGVDYFAEVTIAALPNDATDETAAHLSGLTSLQTLELGSTQLSDAGLAHLSRLTSLQRLSLGGTQVTDAGCRRLEAALPNCKIPRWRDIVARPSGEEEGVRVRSSPWSARQNAQEAF